MQKLSIEELSILLLEPSQTQRRIIESKLAEAGIKNIENVTSSEAAMKAMKTYEPDVVISSMYLKDATGSDLVVAMRKDEALQDIPFMLISSEAKFEALDALKQAGVVAILPKPFEVSELIIALEATTEFLDPEEYQGQDLNADELRILVVDDSNTSRKHISRLLGGMGIEQITLANDGTEAVTLLEEHLYDLVITDYNMPKMDGASLVEYIRNDSGQSGVPILMMTSENDETRLNSVLTSGVSAICDKPFDANHIKQLLSQILP